MPVQERAEANGGFLRRLELLVFWINDQKHSLHAFGALRDEHALTASTLPDDVMRAFHVERLFEA
jgi:hypothetical protein